MERNEVLEKLQEILADQLSVDAQEVKEDSNIIDDLGADSLDIVEMLMAIEEEFDASIPETEVENIKTVSNVIDYIVK